MSLVQTISPQDELSLETATAIFELMSSIWPPANPPTIEEKIAQWEANGITHFVILGDSPENLLAHAMISKREIMTESGPLMVGTLAGVCARPDARGHGYGADVVRAAFDYLPQQGVGVVLFQTALPEFYEKLGSRRVTNYFVNGDQPGNPFWEQHQLIYPATFPWPEGKIDIQGTGF